MPAGIPSIHAAHDVVVVGGGLVGASLAIALERIGIDTGLVEATPPGDLPIVFDERNLSFADATVNALAALGVMQRLHSPTGAIRRIHASRAGDFGRVVLEAAAHGRDAFGQVVVARDFGQALESRLGELDALRRYRPARFEGFVDTDGTQRMLRIAGDGGERRISARLVVAADGTRSAMRDALRIPAREHDYAQTLFVCRVRAERAPDGTAYERLRGEGPTALLPRGDRHYGAIHAVAREDAAAVAGLDDAAFLQRLQDAFGWRVGRFLACGPRNAYPAVGVVADALVAPRAVLVGNAAQTLHPVGAQGFNLGLRDAMTLAELIGAHGLDDVDGLLDAYALHRAGDRARTLAFSDGLARVGANDASLASPLRALGLFAVDRLPSLQSRLVGGAMGYRGDVPALCRAPGMAS